MISCVIPLQNHRCCCGGIKAEDSGHACDLLQYCGRGT